jgi:hypothetical protein
MLVAGKPALKGTPISKNVFRGQDRKFFGNMQRGGCGEKPMAREK